MRSLGRYCAAFVLISAFTIASAAVTCIPTAVPATVRAEGLSERMGDIVLTCSGAANEPVNTNLMVFLSAKITNRINESGVTDAVLTVAAGGDPVPANVPAVLAGPNSIGFLGLQFHLSAAGQAVLRLSNLRAAIGQVNPTLPIAVTAQLGVSGATSIALNNTPLTVATAITGLLAGSGSSPVPVPCSGGSPLPTEINVANLTATSFSFAARVTEGFATAFQKRGPMEDAGTRILLRYSKFPQGSRLFVPDIITGNGALMLVRVLSTDPNGAGGILVSIPGPSSGLISTNSASEVALFNGSGVAVYEVVESDSATRESAQIPTFLGLPARNDGSEAVAQQDISFGPVSTVDTASKSAPIPRFIAALPPQDCTALGDCGDFPKLVVTGPDLTYTAASGSGHQLKYLGVHNEGGGAMVWNVTVNYKTGSGWVRVFPTSGFTRATVRVDVLPQDLKPGRYEATLVVDAGPVAGSRSLPIVFDVTPAQPPVNPPPVEPPQPPVQVVTPEIHAVMHAASFLPDLVPGSLGTIKGLRLAGKEVSVTFDNIEAKILYNSAEQINLLVPAELSGRASALLVVKVDGIAAPAQAILLTPVAPGIFASGILNQDNSVNSVDNPALTGSVVQIFATGLPLPEAGTITAKIHDRDIAVPYYAGPAPGIPGVQQVNLTIPADLPTMTTEVLVCGTAASNPALRVCSRPAKITLRAQ